MKKRFALLAASLTALAVLVPVAPASASSCEIGDPGVEDVQCLVFNEPAVRALCVKLPVC
jgi:hypothetical protein